MDRFHAAFFFLIEGADGADRTVREGELDRSVLVPVPDADTAAAVAAELMAEGGLDLIELYGGLGPVAAAAVIDATGGRVPVGLVGVEGPGTQGDRAVIFASAGADPTRDRYVFEQPGSRMTVVFVPDPSVVPAIATQLVDDGTVAIEVCGGLGPVPAAAVAQAVEDVHVGSVLFGFESIVGAASYRQRYEQSVAALAR